MAGGSLWVAGYGNATVERLAAASGRVTGRVHVGNGPVALAFGAGSLWVANGLDATVSRVDPGALSVRATIPVGSGPAALAAGRGSVWVADQYAGSAARIDRAAIGWRRPWPSAAVRHRSRRAGDGCGWASVPTASATAAGRS